MTEDKDKPNDPSPDDKADREQSASAPEPETGKGDDVIVDDAGAISPPHRRRGPSVGDHVMYGLSADAHCPAIVTGVNEDGTFDLTLFPRGEAPRPQMSVAADWDGNDHLEKIF